MADVGEALSGRFEKFLNPWDKMRPRTDIENRENEPWPTVQLGTGEEALPQSLTPEAVLEVLLKRTGIEPKIPAVTRMGQEAGVQDVTTPTPEEVMKYLTYNESYNPDPVRRKR